MFQPSYVNHSAASSPAASASFAERIKLLIQRVGSATEIARMCGFSEGVVRSWRDGNSDPSRARCVTLAKTLGVSLVWLVAGEGSIQPEGTFANEEAMSSRSHAGRAGYGVNASNQAEDASGVDAPRLNTAMRILQAELELSQSKLTLDQNADLLANLYEILGPGGTHVDTSAMLSFNRRLSERVRQHREAA